MSWEVPTKAAIVDSLTRIVQGTAGARLVACSPDSARAGLQNQVLQTGPGSKKKDVKTGAADSTWLRDVAEENDGVLDDRLLVVTGDRAAVSTICALEGWSEPHVVNQLRDIAPELGWARRLTADEDAALLFKIQSVLPWLQDLPDWYDGPVVDLSALDIEEQRSVYTYEWDGLQVLSPTLSSIFEVTSIEEAQVALDNGSIDVILNCTARIDAQRAIVDQNDGTVQFEFTDADLPIRVQAEIDLYDNKIGSVYLS